MRYLSLLLLGPWLVLLAWIYWAVSKHSRATWRRTVFDLAIIAIALVAAGACALIAYDDTAIGSIGEFGPESGGIWKQVIPALYGYGAFAGVMLVGIAVHLLLRRRGARPTSRTRRRTLSAP